MLILPEAAIAALIGPQQAYDAIKASFVAMAAGDARNFPVIREALGEGRQYGFKSGLDQAGRQLGVKAGGYFPANTGLGLINHQSSILLFDPDTGKIDALVSANLLTALRTAAAQALSIAYLARPQARVLGLMGAGHQAGFQLRAAAKMRAFERVICWNLHPEKLEGIRDIAAEIGLPFEAVTLERMVEADVIVTITSSPQARLLRHHVRPGTHIACMGTDTKGKQEIAPEILAGASVFTDDVAQSISIGEAQHAVGLGLLQADAITPLGAVIAGAHPGRRAQEEITLYDGTGVALQDLAVATHVVRLARAQGIGTEISF